MYAAELPYSLLRGLAREKCVARVAFVAHALREGERSTRLIELRLAELGREWPDPRSPGSAINWFSLPFIPPAGSGGKGTWIDFYIIPVLTKYFLASIKSGSAFQWTEAVPLKALEEAHRDGVFLTVGWGAATKNATGHGEKFLAEHPWLANDGRPWSSTHGDAGSVALSISAMARAGVGRHSRIAVIGANGPIGEAVSLQLARFQPSHILLVGRADRRGSDDNRQRLLALQQRLQAACVSTRVDIHQNAEGEGLDECCLNHKSNIVVTATHGVTIPPDRIPVGAVVFDIAAPHACRPGEGWEGRLVLGGGCGRFENPAVVPQAFGSIGGERLTDVGAGGDLVLWGCTMETIARAAFGWHGHIAGPAVSDHEVVWCHEHFARLGIGPQPPDMFGRPITWEEVRDHVARGV